MAERDFVELLKQAGALKEGHFLLASGRHSDRYVEKFDLLRNPKATEAACAAIIDLVRDLQPEVVVGPTTGGILIAFEVARQLGIPAAYAERREDGSRGREIRRGTQFAPSARVLVVDDILTTGGSVQETLGALTDHDVTVIAVAVLVDRSTSPIDFGVPLFPLLRLDIPSWAASECPLCADNIPLVKPGTTARGSETTVR